MQVVQPCNYDKTQIAPLSMNNFPGCSNSPKNKSLTLY